MGKQIRINSYEMDGKRIKLTFVDGRDYILQHPGNRTYLGWQKEFFSITEGMDQALFLDKAFEFCVIPDGHEFKPTVDTVKPGELGEWSKLLRRFCNGDVERTMEELTEGAEPKGITKKITQ